MSKKSPRILGRSPHSDDIAVVIEPMEDEGWMAAYYVRTTGTPAIVEIRIVPMSGDGAAAQVENLRDHVPAGPQPGQPLAARVLQRLHPGQVVAPFQKAASAAMAAALKDAEAQHVQAAQGDVFLAIVAMLYVEAVLNGSRTPIVDVQEQLNNWEAHRPAAPFSPTQVRDLIVKARREGLLERPEGGGTRPGGRLTPKAEALLAPEEE
ncbi:MAG: hypothetical protein M3401_17870 [Actinomycetota bacterium]|nr:hypothetical protein [Actinomycetota bacterium]